MSDNARFLQLIDVHEGKGAVAVSGSCVRINCTYKNTEFLSNHSFVLEKGGEMTGLVEGIPGMKVGGKRIIQGSADNWYGEDASHHSIPSNVALGLNVELLEVS